MNGTLFGCACGWEGALPPGKENETPCPSCGGDDLALLLIPTPRRRVVTSHESPIRIDWIDGYLLGLTICPGKIGVNFSATTYHERDLELDVEEIAKVADVIVNLVPDDELDRIGVDPRSYVDECEDAGLLVYRFPFEDNTVPEDREGLVRLVRDLRRHLEVGDRVVVHCKGGLGRSGLVAGIILREDGKTAAEARDLLIKARGSSCPTTADQRRWVEEWERRTT